MAQEDCKWHKRKNRFTVPSGPLVPLLQQMPCCSLRPESSRCPLAGLSQHAQHVRLW